MKSCKNCVYNPENNKLRTDLQPYLSGMCSNCQRNKRHTDNFKKIIKSKDIDII
jgi:RNase P subunit RPR2